MTYLSRAKERSQSWFSNHQGYPHTGPKFPGTGGQPTSTLIPGVWAEASQSHVVWALRMLPSSGQHRTNGDYPWALKPNRICLAKFWIRVRSTTSSFFPVSSFWSGQVYLMFAPCILEMCKLSDFPGSRLRRNFTSRWIVLWGSPISDFRWYLEGTFKFCLNQEWAKTFGAAEIE